MAEKKSRKIIVLIFACVFLCMLVFNFLTPLVSDDFAHLKDSSTLFESLRNLRENTNGRVFSHFFVYVSLRCPKAIFNVVNAAISALVLYLIFRFFRSDNKTANILLLTAAVFMLWYFMPGFGQIFLWLTGACNYSWGLAIDLLIIYTFYFGYSSGDYFENRGIFIKILYVFLAFFMGGWSENGACASIFVIAAFLVLIWGRDKKLPIFYGILLLSALAGFIFLMSAPSEFGGRTADFSSSSSIFDNAKYCLQLTEKYCTALFAVYFAALALSIFCRVDKRAIISSGILFLAGLLSIGVFVFAAYLPHRSFFIVISFTVIACLILLQKLWDNGEKKPIVCGLAVIAVLFLFSFVLGAGDILSLYMQSAERKQTAINAVSDGETDINLKPYASSTMYPAAFYEELDEDSTFWYNEFIAEYYGLNTVTAETEG